MKTKVESLGDFTRDRIVRLTEERRPVVLPADWRTGEKHPNATWYFSTGGLRVMVEVEHQAAAGLWTHLSVSRADKMPSYADLSEVKGLFIGKDRKAIMVLPPAAEHYSFHEFCLHLFSPIDRDPLPDFRTPESKL